MIIRELNRTGSVKEKIVCIIDDNSNKWGREVDGIKVYGGRDSILQAVREYGIDKIFILKKIK